MWMASHGTFESSLATIHNSLSFDSGVRTMTELEAVEIGKAITAGQFSILLKDKTFLFAPEKNKIYLQRIAEINGKKLISDVATWSDAQIAKATCRVLEIVAPEHTETTQATIPTGMSFYTDDA